MKGAILDKNHNLVEKKQPNVMHNRWLVISLKIAIVIDLFHIFQTSCWPECDELATGQRSCGIPGAENHSSGHSNGASSWFPNTLAHGMPLAFVGDIAWSQYKLAFAIGMLLAVMTSPRYTTKSAL